MNLDEFRESVRSGRPPASASPALRALWSEARGGWDEAHSTVQDESDRDSAWVHAYLHRKEGDLSNARYWYRRAGRPEATGDDAEEWEAIVAELLGTQPE